MREIRMLRTTWRELETELRDGLRHRRVAKAAGKPLLPVPTATAPAFDPTQREAWRNGPKRHRALRRPTSVRPSLPLLLDASSFYPIPDLVAYVTSACRYRDPRVFS